MEFFSPPTRYVSASETLNDTAMENDLQVQALHQIRNWKRKQI